MAFGAAARRSRRPRSHRPRPVPAGRHPQDLPRRDGAAGRVAVSASADRVRLQLAAIRCDLELLDIPETPESIDRLLIERLARAWHGRRRTAGRRSTTYAADAGEPGSSCGVACPASSRLSGIPSAVQHRRRDVLDASPCAPSRASWWLVDEHLPSLIGPRIVPARARVCTRPGCVTISTIRPFRRCEQRRRDVAAGTRSSARSASTRVPQPPTAPARAAAAAEQRVLRDVEAGQVDDVEIARGRRAAH